MILSEGLLSEGAAVPSRALPAGRARRHDVVRPREAVILAAGAGTRLREHRDHPPKPLTQVLDATLLEHSIRRFVEHGVRHCTVVVGFEGIEVARAARLLGQQYEVAVTAVQNADWERGNGTSVLAASAVVGRPFFLAMGDHLFDPAILRTLEARAGEAPLVLAVDHAWEHLDAAGLDEATKVRLRGSSIVDIGKDLRTFDAIDTGIFLCRPDLFPALETAQRAGDASLSGAVRVLAARGKAEAVSVTGCFWQDVDTPADRLIAEQSLAAVDAADGPLDEYRGLVPS